MSSKKHLLPILRPEAEIALTDLFQVEELQRIQDAFAHAIGVASLITTPTGTAITEPTNFSRLCRDLIRTTEKGRANCVRSDSMIGVQRHEGAIAQPCLSCGLWDAGASITVDGKHLATWLVGQVRCDGFDEEKALAYAREIGADVEEFRQALQEISVMPRGQFQRIADLLFLLANELSQKAFQNLQRDMLLKASEVKLRESKCLFNIASLVSTTGDIDLLLEHSVRELALSRPCPDHAGAFISFRDHEYSFGEVGRLQCSSFADIVVAGQISGKVQLGCVQHCGLSPECRDQGGMLQTVAHTLSTAIEQKLAERALRQSESDIRSVFEAVNDAIFIVDSSDFRILEVNQMASRALGYSREELIGMPVQQIDGKRAEAYVRERVSELLFNGECLFETTHIRKDGSVFPVEINGRLFSFHGKSACLCAVRDISSRKEAEEALRASKERYRRLYDHNLAAVFHAVPKRLLDFNDALCRMLGYTREELATIDASDLYCDAEVREAGFKLLNEHGQLKNFEVDLRRKDGSTITVLADLNLLRLQPGHPPVAAGVMLDITEVRKLREQLLQSQKLEALGQLTGGIAHDFNNLLMIITSYSEMLQNELGADSSIARSVTQICSAADRAATLTRQLLAFSRKQIMKPVVLDLGSVVVGMEEMLRRLIGEAVTLRVTAASDLWMTKADPGQIEQVVINLVVNARDAMPSGGLVNLRITNVELGEDFTRVNPGSKAGQYVAMSVADTGAGIAPAIQARIFEPFFTTKESGKGTGLGLSTVYGIVKQSGGYITAQSELGHGAEFCVYLPRTMEGKKTEEHGHPPVRSAAPMKVLLVEDEDATRGAIADYLQLHGFEVTAAPNAADALHICSRNPESRYDVLLTDVIMPGMNGMELANQFRAKQPGIPVIFMSGYTDSVLLESGMRLPDDTVVAKPFRLPDLLSKLRHAATAKA